MDISARHLKSRHLAAFVATVRLGSLKAAADRVGLTQSAVTKTLNDLESVVGARLLVRDRGGARLTHAGEVFFPFAQQSLAALGHGLASLEALDRGTSAPVRIGALPSVAAGVLPDAVQRFLALAPGSPLTVVDGPIGTLLEQLRSGAVDLVIGRMGEPAAMTGLRFVQLYAEQVVFAAAAGHPLADSRDVAALTDVLLIYPPRNAAIRPLVERFVLAEGAVLRGQRIESVSEAFGRAMVLGPLAPIWLISQGVVARDVAAGRMTTLPIGTDLMSGPVGIMSREGEDLPPQVRLFHQVVTGQPTT